MSKHLSDPLKPSEVNEVVHALLSEHLDISLAAAAITAAWIADRNSAVKQERQDVCAKMHALLDELPSP